MGRRGRGRTGTGLSLVPPTDVVRAPCLPMSDVRLVSGWESDAHLIAS